MGCVRVNWFTGCAAYTYKLMVEENNETHKAQSPIERLLSQKFNEGIDWVVGGNTLCIEVFN
jgi:hypothetical protein